MNVISGETRKSCSFRMNANGIISENMVPIIKKPKIIKMIIFIKSFLCFFNLESLNAIKNKMKKNVKIR